MSEATPRGGLARVWCGKKFVATNGGSCRSDGLMFTMKALNRIEILGLDIDTIEGSSDAQVEIWTKKGGHHGFESSRNGWTT